MDPYIRPDKNTRREITDSLSQELQSEKVAGSSNESVMDMNNIYIVLFVKINIPLSSNMDEVAGESLNMSWKDKSFFYKYLFILHGQQRSTTPDKEVADFLTIPIDDLPKDNIEILHNSIHSFVSMHYHLTPNNSEFKGYFKTQSSDLYVFYEAFKPDIIEELSERAETSEGVKSRSDVSEGLNISKYVWGILDEILYIQKIGNIPILEHIIRLFQNTELQEHTGSTPLCLYLWSQYTTALSNSYPFPSFDPIFGQLSYIFYSPPTPPSIDLRYAVFVHPQTTCYFPISSKYAKSPERVEASDVKLWMKSPVKSDDITLHYFSKENFNDIQTIYNNSFWYVRNHTHFTKI